MEELIREINDADMVLIGIGEEFSFKNEDNKDKLVEAYNKIAKLVSAKNHYIVSLCKDSLIYDSNIIADNMVIPFNDVLSEDAAEEKWNVYLKWLSCTLNRKLFIIELGVGLEYLQVIRWPFEKTAMINAKAKMIRVNENIPNIPADISDKAVGIKQNSVEYILDIQI